MRAALASLRMSCGLAWAAGLALALYIPAAQALVCASVFPNAASTTGRELKLETDASLINTGGGVLTTDDLRPADTTHCDGAACTASGSRAPQPTLPENTSSTNYTGSPLSFTAGDHYYDDFSLEDGLDLTISGGTVRIHVGHDLKIKPGATVNLGGDATELIFLVGNNAEVKVGAEVHAVIYSGHDLKVEDDAVVTGAVTAEKVEIRKRAQVTYTPVSEADMGSFCSTGLPGSQLCSTIFTNAAGATGDRVKLRTGSALANTGDRVLQTSFLETEGTNAYCDGSACIASGDWNTVVALPPNASTTDFKGTSIALTAGDHYYNNFELQDDGVLTVSGGTVRVHVGNDLKLRNRVLVNTGGESTRLIFLVGHNVEIADDAQVKAFVYAVNDILVKKRAEVAGALVGDKVEVQEDSTVTYAPAANLVVDGVCTGVIDAFAFNCTARADDPVTGRLYLQKVDTAFTFDVIALKDADEDGSADGIETDFAGGEDRDLSIELVNTAAGGDCAARPALSPAVAQTLTFTGADFGRKTAAAMSVGKAYRSVGCRVTDSEADPAVIACSGDSFAVRPSALTLGTPALDNTGSSGSPSQAAGTSFSLSVSGGAGYDGTPQVDGSKVTAHVGAVRTGVLSGSFSPADAGTGIATGADFDYDEVGSFRFAAQGLYDALFTAVDQPGDCTDDFSNTAVDGRYGCKFGNSADTAWVGRFTPDHFTTAVVTDGALAEACAAGGFSYQGQATGFSADPRIRITARNAAGAVTQNYTGGYAKLDTGSFTFDPVSGDAGQLGVDGSTPVALSWSTGTPALTDNGDGTLDLTLSGDTFTWGRGDNDRVAPFTTDLDLSLSAIGDDDGVAGSGLPEVIEPLGVDMRFGRLALVNAHGSELQDLAVPMQVEAYQGAANGFVVNTADTCTGVTGLAIADLNAGDGLLPAETCIWDDADATGLGCTGPGPGGSQYAATPLAGRFNLHLKAPGGDNSGVLSVAADAPDWLEFDWAGGGDIDPSARATFGIFNRSSSIIYQRELR